MSPAQDLPQFPVTLAVASETLLILPVFLLQWGYPSSSCQAGWTQEQTDTQVKVSPLSFIYSDIIFSMRPPMNILFNDHPKASLCHLPTAIPFSFLWPSSASFGLIAQSTLQHVIYFPVSVLYIARWNVTGMQVPGERNFYMV